MFIGIQQEELRDFRRALTRASSHDTLTGFFNGTVFSSMIDRRAGSLMPAGRWRGTFLIVEISKLREINMRYGLAWGNEALKAVAAAIRASVRSGDIVGRININEFGVFLPGASKENAVEIGERIREGVAAAYFAPAGGADMLTVSVGGVVFENDLDFDNMFRAAAKLLAKSGPADKLQLSIADGGQPSALH